MSEKKYTAESKIWEKLKTGELFVQFIKKDGSERLMRCTLNLDKVPKDMHPKNKVEYDNSVTKRVFDLDKQAWRSFRYDSVIDVHE